MEKTEPRMERDELLRYLDATLETARFRDYCPNGLQMEGRAEVRRLVAGVTRDQALLEAAIARGADAIPIHHGWFWKGEDGRITGIRRRRLRRCWPRHQPLAFHLPLDAHPELGNNAAGRRLGWLPEARSATRTSPGTAALAHDDGRVPLAASVAAGLGRRRS